MKVLITRIISESGLKVLADAGFAYTQYTEKVALSQADLIKMCKEHDAFISVGPNIIDTYFLKECKHLKAISLLSAGYDNVDVNAANKLKIPIGHTPGVVSGATADVAFLLMLAVSRNAFYMHNSITKGNWGFFEPTVNLGVELNGKTLGIFGLGKIGFELARKCAAAYNMKIIYHNRSRNIQAEQAFDAQLVSFETLLKESNVLSVHAGLSDETKDLFNKNAFIKMKTSSIFINTARGAIINELDLIEVLKKKKIAGAALDVQEQEPPELDNPLFKMKNVILTPHIGWRCLESRQRLINLLADNVEAYLKGSPINTH